MKENIVLIDGMATAREAVSQMRSKNIDFLIVDKRDEQDAYGILVIQDIVKGAIIAERTLDEVNVYEIMTKPVLSVPADMDIRYVAGLLIKFGLKVAPIEDNGRYLGTISLSDIVLHTELG